MLLSFAVQSTILLLSSLATADSSSSLTTRAEGKATDGLVIGHLFPACNGRRKKQALSVPVDKWFVTLLTRSRRVLTLSIIANSFSFLQSLHPQSRDPNQISRSLRKRQHCFPRSIPCEEMWTWNTG